MSRVISIDLGASNGRLILLSFEKNRFKVEDVHKRTDQ